ncbi:efflux transporter outer membrane subunit [Flavobacterium sharifuzzamanii]|uniref:efflux transporter outer membrane subunit n=1 Tax=Flavobacterium sharifuzzamanii TaxID=2211133 RepID=UPI000DAF1C0B|nr:efflux transporter outer membrane subunit [Flavobacterium sharifuzzamanii]KAF2079962.1 efflux transporter outer membrane subunit [Flavobacterium sharifuzzamanii]
MTNSSNKYILLVMTAALISACSVTKKYERPTTLKTDQLYRDQSTTDSTTIADMPWNTVFKDEKLNALIQKGLEQNLNLKNAIENIVQARASLRQSKLAYYPSLQLDANVTHNKQSQAGLNFPAGININTLTTTYKLGVSSSWEIDVWGKLSSSKRAALATYLASDAAKQAVQTQLIADIANNYFLLLSYDESLKITEETLKSRIENVATIKALKEGAIVTGAAVVQSEANQHAAEVLIPDLKQSIRETENAINILLGQGPGPIDRGVLGTQIIPEKIAIGMPAQLLNNRPDVRQAEFNFRVAFESTNLAKTYFYPSLTLTASTGFSNLELKDFFSNSIFYSIIGGLTQPLFNHGLNKMRLTTAQSQQLQAYNNFQQSLLVAGQEVSNALYAYQMAVEKEDSRAKQIAALEKAVDFTQELLEYSSATNYTDVLTSQQNLLAAQLNGVNDNLQKLQAVINLYRALGGGWK